MKHKKQLCVLLLLVCVALAAFSGCGKKKKPGSEAKESESVEPLPELPALVVPDNFGKTIFTMKEWTGETNSKDINGEKVNQSDVVTVNTIPDRTTEALVYQTVERAIKGARDYDYGQSAYYQLLTGKDHPWQLAVYENMSKAEEAGVCGNFFKTDYNMKDAPKYEGKNKVGSYSSAYYGGFKDVTLPASWQTQGFDFPIYSNTAYPWNAYKNGTVKPPTAPTKTNSVGFYRTTFDVSKEFMNGRSVYLSFGGVESCFYVWVNGKEVGYSEDSYVATEFDITPYLNKDGKDNLLAVMVIRWCDGSYFENQDFLRLAGIFRDVYIHSAPGVQIFDYTVLTELDDSYQNADLKVSAEIKNMTSEEASGYYVGVQLFDADGKSVFGDGVVSDKADKIASGGSASVSLKNEVEKAHLWSDEDPYLYTMVLTLYNKDGVAFGSQAQQLGFRELKFTPGSTKGTYETVLLNGKPIMLKGVDRHDTSPTDGKYVSHELYETDITAMKQLNINAVRTSHYPDDKYLYYLCDKYGIFVLAEANVETHYNVNDSETARYFKELVTDRIMSQIHREKNRTSILIWSLGNETSRSPVYQQLIKQMRELDPTRMIHFESYGTDGGVDLGSGMYWDLNGMEGMGKAANHKPWIQCEYAHAMGNSVGNLKEYFDLVRSYDNLLGAFIWDFVDQSIATEIPITKKQDYYGNGKYYAFGGCWGDQINSGDFCQNGILSPDRTWQPECYEVQYVYQSVWFYAELSDIEAGKVKIYNEFSVVDLSEYDFAYELVCDGKVIDQGTLDVSCKPRETVEVTVPFKLGTPVADGEYFLNLKCMLKKDTVWAKKGYVIAHEQFQVPAEISHVTADTSKMPALTLSEDDTAYTIKGDKFEITLKKENGTIGTYTYDGKELIKEGPTVNFRRAKLSNDRDFPWNGVRGKEASSIKVEKDDNNKWIRITVEQVLASAGNSTLTNVYTFYGSGEIGVASTLNQDPSMGEMAKFGEIITLPGEYENITFYGGGFWDSYNDRKQGTNVGLYHTTVTESLFPYGRLQDSGNKTDVRYIALTSENSPVGLMVVSSDVMEASALHNSVSSIEQATYTYNLAPVKTNTYLNIDYGSRGTGGASCGPETLPQYRLSNKGTYAYSYTIVPYDKNAEDLGAIAKPWRNSLTVGEMYARPVVEMIEQLKVSQDNLAQARAAYDALKPEYQAYVTNYNELKEREEYQSKKYVLKDVSGHGFDAELTGGKLDKDAGAPNGYSYDGSFLVPDQNGKIDKTFAGTAQFTLGVFAKFNSFNAGNVLAARSDYQVSIKIVDNNELEFFVQDGGWQTLNVSLSKAGINPNTWHYIVGVRDGEGLKLYVDGKLVGSRAYNGSVNSTNAPFGVGITDGMSYRLNGAISSLQVFDTAKTESEIAAQYEAAKKGSSSFNKKDAVLWYDMDQFTTK